MRAALIVAAAVVLAWALTRRGRRVEPLSLGPEGEGWKGPAGRGGVLGPADFVRAERRRKRRAKA